MKVVALVSGGKDSCYAMMKCIQYGHEIVALANLLPADDSVDELDSYMYQTVGHQIIVSYAECMGVPLFRRRIQGSSREQKLNYSTTPGDEVEDMFVLLNEVKRQIPCFRAVSSGAIASDYQRLRVESVCSRLGLISLAYLWKQDQSILLQEMIANDIVAITVKVAAMGLDPAKHLGKDIAFLKPYLHKLNELYGINVCGEGGEYETLTLDCPLFVNARIVLEEFTIVLHSSDSIAPVAVIHPLAFHLENKRAVFPSGNPNDLRQEKTVSVIEVQGECSKGNETTCQSDAETTDIAEVTRERLCLSKTQKDNLFSISCWLQDSGNTSNALKEDLTAVLKHIESQLARYGFGWECAVYIHLYIADMNEFVAANEVYVQFITQKKCPFGVPSRSTIELPLWQVGLGRACIEVLVSTDQRKNVLHVQSISSWAPSCIGPYSQATLHKEMLYMAGQLGLDPPTMALCSGGPGAELERALENSEAVAKCFDCSICSSAVLFTIYCSKQIPLADSLMFQEKWDSCIKHMRLLEQEERSMHKILDPIILYVLVPDLPKRALVEVKPLLFVAKDTDMEDVTVDNPDSSTMLPNCWDFEQGSWHNSCIQRCVINGKICGILLSINSDIVVKICSEYQCNNGNDKDQINSLTNEQMERVSRFCIYLLDKVLTDSYFSWKDTMTLRFYFQTSLGMKAQALSVMFTSAFEELSQMGRKIDTGAETLFSVVPVLGAGRYAASMDDVITCELIAQKAD